MTIFTYNCSFKYIQILDKKPVHFKNNYNTFIVPMPDNNITIKKTNYKFESLT